MGNAGSAPCHNFLCSAELRMSDTEAQPTQHDGIVSPKQVTTLGPTLRFSDGSYEELDSGTTLAGIIRTHPTAYIVERDNPHKAHRSSSFVAKQLSLCPGTWRATRFVLTSLMSHCHLAQSLKRKLELEKQVESQAQEIKVEYLKLFNRFDVVTTLRPSSPKPNNPQDRPHKKQKSNPLLPQ
jgi:hypothetical protein